uniref:MIF4G_like_2 domain-containing protein n=1 Tax=Meloidogyne hapla TaxID=6305 RepID=A0A1I8B868_MELHA
MGFMGMNQTLSDGVIQLLANKSAESITPTVYSAIKEAFACSTLTNSTNEQVLSMLASKCSDGWNEILNLCHAVNATMSKLPPHVIQIFSKDFQTLTPDELVQMGELFPKLKWLFSLNFYKLMDLLAQTMQGDEEAKMKFEELGMKMYQNRNKCY